MLLFFYKIFMKKILLLFCLFICNNTKAQLVLEGILTTGMNMTIKRQDFHPESPLNFFTLTEDFAGINGGGNIGLRLFLMNKTCSIGGNLGYLFRYHEAGSTFLGGSRRISSRHPEHFIVLPLDLGYHFKSGLGIHAGVESSWLITPRQSNESLFIQNAALISPLVGCSYSYKRFRVDLLYKHTVNPLFISKTPVQLPNSAEIHVDKIYYRHHDIELRLVYRILQLEDI